MLNDNISHVLPEKQKVITNTYHSSIQQHTSIKQIMPVNSSYHKHKPQMIHVFRSNYHNTKQFLC